MTRFQISRLFLQALAIAALGACAGGGGGGGGTPVVMPPPPPPSTPRPPPVALPPLPPPSSAPTPNTSSQEYGANWGVAGVRAPAAWQFENGHGEGVVIGVIDDGIDPTHPELVGRVDTVNSVDIVSGRNQLTTSLSHGSELAAIMVGNFNNSQTVGVAYEATVLAVRADNGADGFLNQHLAAAINYAVSVGVDVITLSLGSSNPLTSDVSDAIRNATQNGVIIVTSAGNSGPSAANPNYPGCMATNPSVSNGLMLIAGGSNPDGSFNTISNRAGSAAQHYLVAPGWAIIVPDMGPPGPVPGFQTCGLGPSANLCQIQGTSYASPHVAAAVALLKSAFPGLTPTQVVQIILQSTDDMGVPGIDEQTGWGSLNLERAFAPIGTVSAPLMAAAGAIEINPGATLGVAGPPFGDGLTANAAAWTVAGFDSYGRTYPIDFSSRWLSASRGVAPVAQAPRLWRGERSSSGAYVQMAFADDLVPESYRPHADRADFGEVATRIDTSLAPGLSFSFAAHGAELLYAEAGGAGHLDFAQSDMSLGVTRRLNEAVSISFVHQSGEAANPISGLGDVTASSARASFDLGAVGVDLILGRVREDNALLGLAWAGEFGDTPAGQTQFIGLNWRLDAPVDWRIAASAEAGLADMDAQGWLSIEAPLRTSAYALAAERSYTPDWLGGGHGSLRFTIAQPLRVESGALSFMAPVATNYGRASLEFEQRRFEPVPSGRELRFGVGYHFVADDRISAFGEVVHVHEPGHVAAAEDDTIVRVGIRMAQ